MYRQSNNSKQVFYKGITLKDYLRKSQVLMTEDNRDETLLVDEFNHPLVKIEDLVSWDSKPSKKHTSDRQKLSTEVSTTKSIDQDQIFPPLQNQKPMAIPPIKTNPHLKCSELSNNSKKRLKATQLPLLDQSKSKILKPQNLKNEFINNKRVLPRQKCMASRQVSEQSQDQLQTYKKSHPRSLSNCDYIQLVKKQIKQRRQLRYSKVSQNASRSKASPVQNRSPTEEI